MSKDGYLPPGVTYNDIDPPQPPECDDCEVDGKDCPGPWKCDKIKKEPSQVDDRDPDE